MQSRFQDLPKQQEMDDREMIKPEPEAVTTEILDTKLAMI